MVKNTDKTVQFRERRLRSCVSDVSVVKGLNPDAGLGLPFLCVSNTAQESVVPEQGCMVAI